jgi:hypothetical protein
MSGSPLSSTQQVYNLLRNMLDEELPGERAGLLRALQALTDVDPDAGYGDAELYPPNASLGSQEVS